MSHTVALPYWLFVLLGLLAVWAALEHVLLPALRWALRRRVEAVLQELGPRLQVEIPPLKLARREMMIERLRVDDRVHEAARRESARTGEPLKQVQARANAYAREIVPAFNAYFYFRVGYWLARLIARSLYRVRLGYADEAGLAAIEPKSTVVFVINHRSNFDYVLVAFLAAERAALSYAVGEWARIWPLEMLIRRMGAYFVRRNSGDTLYRAVLQRYVQMATEAGVTQALFPEGGLSVDGRLRAPKLGLLDYMLRGYDPVGERDLVFVPVGINYDRVLEDRTLLRRLDPTAPTASLPGALLAAAGFALKQALLRVRGRWFRFGYACVNFGTPLSMRRHLRERGSSLRALSEEQRRREVELLGGELMRRIEAIVPVLPVALVARVFVEAGERPLEALEVKADAFQIVQRLAARQALIYLPRGDQDYAIEVGLRMLALRRMALEENGLYRANPDERPLLGYYANSIAHLLE
jgi:glycerol-3-phosphate O-acyltransferase